MTNTKTLPFSLGRSKIALCLFLGATLAGCRGGDGGYAEHPRVRRSVLLFLVDTLRADRLGCYGYDRDTSPALDRLAEDGVLFENCFAQSSWTKPATASILTGLHPSFHGANHRFTVLPEDLVTLPQLLRDHGYRTGAFLANGFIFDRRMGFDRGFDEFRGYGDPPPDSPVQYVRGESPVTDAIEWIEGGGEEPFFAFVHIVDPHSPYGAPAPYESKFAAPYDGRLKSPVDFTLDREVIHELDESDWEFVRSLYDGEIAYSDAQFARILKSLRERGLSEETLVVFVSDHGEEFYDHRDFGHPPTILQELIHVPLVVKIPGLPDEVRGLRMKGACRQVDLLPTILDSVGVPIPPEIQGTSLLPRIFAEDQRDGPPVVSEVDKDGRSRKSVIVDGRKYIRQWAPHPQEYFFDLRKDPGELENYAGTGRALADRQRLKGLLDAYVESSTQGIFLVAFNQGADASSIRIFVEGELETTSLLYAEEPKAGGGTGDRGGESVLLKKIGDGRPVTRWFLNTGIGDRDGLSFLPRSDAEEIKIVITAGGKPLDPGSILLGSKGLPASSNPVILRMSELKPLVSGALESPPFDDRLAVRIWWQGAQIAATAELDEKTRKNLEALGYIDR